MSSAGIIFDGDDTLWYTMPIYTKAKQEFFDEMFALGFDPEEVERTFEQIDAQNVSRFGFSKRRFPTSMEETYQLFCRKHRFPLDEAVRGKIINIGISVFAKPPTLSSDVERVLNLLHRRYKLILATKGDQEVQQAKIDQTGLSPFFSSIYILAHKTTEELRTIAEECELNIFDSWVVGDSLKSDINPGLQVGFKAIWLRTDTWSYEKDPEPDSNRLYAVSTLLDTLGLLIPEEA
jgi:putative hydrolase of the HAD superfamily